MNWLYTPLVFPVLSGAFITILLAAYAWQRRRAAGALPFAWLMLAVTSWSLGYAVELGGQTLAVLQLGNALAHTGITAVSYFWLWFAWAYTGRRRRLQRRSLILLALIPVLTLLLIWTNPLHGLIWRSVRVTRVGDTLLLAITARGPWFWVFLAYSYALLLWGTGVMLRFLVQRTAFVRWSQSMGLMGGLLLPWVGSLLHVLAVTTVDLTPFGFALGGLLVAWDISRSRLFEVMPVAHRTVWARMRDAMLLLDAQHRVVDVNPAALALFGAGADGRALTTADVIDQPLAQLRHPLSEALLPHVRGQYSSARITLNHGDAARAYELQVSPFANRLQQVTGHLLVLHDVTEQTAAETALRAQKQLYENLVALASTAADRGALYARLQDTLRTLQAQTGATCGCLYLLHEAGRETAVFSQPDAAPQGTDAAALFHRPFLEAALRQPDVRLIADVHADAAWQPAPAMPAGVRAVLAAPLRSEAEAPLGLLLLYHDVPAYFDAAHAALAQAAARQIALVLRSAAVLAQQQRSSDQQIITYKLLRAMGASLEPERVAYIATETVAELTGWPVVAISMPEAAGERLVLRAAVGVPRIDDGVNGRAMRTGQTQMVPDPAQPLPRPDYVALAVPLRRGRERLGVFNVEVDAPQTFTPADMQLAESLAEAIVLALDNARLFQTVAEEQSRLRALIESDQDGIVLVGLDGRILVVNQPVLTYLQLAGTPADWVGRQLVTPVYLLRRRAPEAARTVLGELRRVRTGAEPAAEGEFEVGPRAINWRNLPVLDGAAPLGRLLVLRDITEKRLLEQMRDDLMHTMVHDLRGPLTSISVSLHLLDAFMVGSEDGRARDTLTRAHKSMETVLALVNAILDISRLESGRMGLNLQQLSLSELASHVLEWQLPLIHDRRQQLVMAVPANLPPVLADADLLGRVLQNLIGNAIKFTPAGGTITLVAGVETAVGGQTVVVVRVQDTGSGIPPELLPRIFQKFTRGPEEKAGSGLGLYFCKMVLEAHGQRIWVDGSSAGGTTVCFSLAAVRGP
ncbi:MAG: GAF domain-containing protein [Anaerolineales bacterium]|nr:GAF domain-containing protein [Anaerolineales bacterium]